MALWPMGSGSLCYTALKIFRKFPMHQFLIYGVSKTNPAHCLDLCSFVQNNCEENYLFAMTLENL